MPAGPFFYHFECSKSVKFLLLPVPVFLLLGTACGPKRAELLGEPGDRYNVACYYFPNYHPDARNTDLYGVGWTEWELVKPAMPRFGGHRQPRIPVWGYDDEPDPARMAMRIDAAVAHGIDAFIFDWYYYDYGLFLQRALEEGFMKAANVDRMKFGLMWANRDWLELFPFRACIEKDVHYPGAVSPQTCRAICDLVVDRYFAHPSYWRVDGSPCFSFFDLKFLEKWNDAEEINKRS